jgi:glycosyltransferase involved in cell wall biosynthesis
LTVLIPAYKPGDKLVNLVSQIKASSVFTIVVVNDGSGSEYDRIFNEVEKLGCKVLVHRTNRGKGRALKTGFEYILKKTGEVDGVVTADADGQHLVPDILSVAASVIAYPGSIVLGERKFTGKVPLRSIIGNKITRLVFSLVSGLEVRDTQTGLRGFSMSVLSWLVTVEGERFEYEMNMLLKAKNCNIEFKRVDISTVYPEGNHSSHFHTVRDSVLVYLPILKFCLSSLCGAAVDYASLFVIARFTGSLLIAVVGARVLSSAANFILNRLFVFSRAASGRKTIQTALKYYALVCIILASNYFLLRFFTVCGIRLFWSKILTEAILFLFSYIMQHLFVFKSKSNLVNRKSNALS